MIGVRSRVEKVHEPDYVSTILRTTSSRTGEASRQLLRGFSGLHGLMDEHVFPVVSESYT